MQPGKRKKDVKGRSRPRKLVPIAGLLLVAGLALVFNILIIQMQSAAAAYLSGESIWSRAQVSAVQYLDRYGENGNPAALEKARDWLAIPLGDLQARRAMEGQELDAGAAREGLLQGRNHPDDIPGMIRLFRHFSQAPHFRDAVAFWRESDPHILALETLAEQLENAWQSASPSLAEIPRMRQRLLELNEELDILSEGFRTATAEAARWLARMLVIASVVLFLTLGLIAWLLGWRLTRALTASERIFRTTFRQAPMGMAQVDDEGRLLDVNPALCEILGQSREKLLGMPYEELVHPDERDILLEDQEKMPAGALENHSVEHRLLCGNGETLWAKVTVSSIHDDADSRPHRVVILEDVSESRRLSLALSYEATHDPLTGLYNRRAFQQGLSDILHRAHVEGSTHALCFIDLDQFKVVNDTAGHIAGDELLCRIAELLQGNLRERDLLARLGGDEFAVILEDCSLDDAARITEKLRAAVAERGFEWEDATFHPGCSIGVVPITRDSPDTGYLLQAADIACYRAKKQGRNRVHVLREDEAPLDEGPSGDTGRIATP